MFNPELFKNSSEDLMNFYTFHINGDIDVDGNCDYGLSRDLLIDEIELYFEQGNKIDYYYYLYPQLKSEGFISSRDHEINITRYGHFVGNPVYKSNFLYIDTLGLSCLRAREFSQYQAICFNGEDINIEEYELIYFWLHIDREIIDDPTHDQLLFKDCFDYFYDFTVPDLILEGVDANIIDDFDFFKHFFDDQKYTVDFYNCTYYLVISVQDYYKFKQLTN